MKNTEHQQLINRATVDGAHDGINGADRNAHYSDNKHVQHAYDLGFEDGLEANRHNLPPPPAKAEPATDRIQQCAPCAILPRPNPARESAHVSDFSHGLQEFCAEEPALILKDFFTA